MINDIPVMKFFIHNNRYFLYDTYTNSLLEISKNQYIEISYLNSIGLNRYKALNKNNQAYLDTLMLIQKGMLQAPFVDKVRNLASDYIETLLNRSVNDITLQVTRNCNFCCRYCLFANSDKLIRKHQKLDMSWEIAKKSVDFLYNHSIDAPKITISFYGGEPLLNFDLIKKVVNYTKEKFLSKPITYRMTINGSLLTNEVIDFIAQNHFIIAISLDGNEEIQNNHRVFYENGVGTFSIVYKNIVNLKNKYPDYFKSNISFMPVIFEDESRDKVFNFFEDNDISLAKVIPLEADLCGIDYKNSDIERNIINVDHVRVLEGEHNAEMDQYYKNKNNIPPVWHHNGPCIPAIKRLFVSVDGVFYSCEKVPEYDELSIGNLKDGFNISKILEMMNIGKLTEEKCKRCWAMRFCNICYIHCIDLDAKIISSDQKPCKYQQDILLKYLKNKIDKL